MTIARATIKSVNDKTKLRQLDVEALQGEQLPAVEHFEGYGFTSVPVASDDSGKAEAIVAFVGGSRSHPVVVAWGDRRSRPTGLAPGDSVIYHKNGSKVHLSSDGIAIETAGNPATFTAGGVTMKFSSTGLEITGGTIKHNGKDIGDTHSHTGVMPGPANTGPPA